MVGRNFVVHHEVAVDAVVDELCGIDWDVDFVAEVAGSLDVVGVVVRNQNGTDVAFLDAVFCHDFFQAADADACVNNESVGLGAQVVAVATTSTSETNKCQHGEIKN